MKKRVVKSKYKPRQQQAGKTGPPGKEEKKLITDLAARGIPLEEIATRLGNGRTVEVIEKVLAANPKVAHIEISQERQDYMLFAKKLSGRKYWRDLQQQFAKDELDYFRNTWINFMMQFRDNILFGEELQLKQLIIIDIMINRCMKDRKKHITDMERLQTLLDREYLKDDKSKDAALIVQLEQQISFARNSLTSYTSEYTKLLDRQKDINKDLKATRDQRIKKIEDSKTSFSGWLKQLEDEILRERIGHDAGIKSLAKDKAKEELGNYHTFIDGKIDQPFLTPDTVKDDE